MAVVTYYVNAVNGNDTNNGSSDDGTVNTNAFKTISKAFSTIASDSTDDVTINLAGTLASPMTYTETTSGNAPTFLDLSSYEGKGSLTIMPASFVQSLFMGGTYDPCDPTPLSPTLAFNPAGTKPCIIPSVKMGSGIQLVGVNVKAAATPVAKWGVLYQQAQGMLYHCRIEGHEIGLQGQMGCATLVMSSCFVANGIGASLQLGAIMALLGQNLFLDNVQGGIRARTGAAIAVGPAFDLGVFSNGLTQNPTIAALSLNPTEIRTTAPRDAYTAIELNLAAALVLSTGGLDLSSLSSNLPSEIDGYLKIINASGYDSGSYVGVSMDTLSFVLGGDNIIFYENGINGGNPTIPEARQFVQREGRATVVVP